MKIFNHPDSIIHVCQFSVLAGEQDFKKSHLLVDDNYLGLEILDSKPFSSYYDSNNQYYLWFNFDYRNTTYDWKIALELKNLDKNKFWLTPTIEYLELLRFIQQYFLHEKFDSIDYQLIKRISPKTNKI